MAKIGKLFAHQIIPLLVAIRMVALFGAAPVALAASSNGTESASVSAVSIAPDAFAANEFVSRINAARSEAGLSPLQLDSQLTVAAHAKVEDMVANSYWAHFGPAGQTPWQFITASGYVYHRAGENLARGFATPAGIMQALLASPTHRANILGNYTDVGIACVPTLDQSGHSVLLTVEEFGAH